VEVIKSILEMKKGFSLIEMMISILLIAFVMVGTVKAYRYLATSHKQNEIRYMALRAIDSEMNRLVFSYENFEEEDWWWITPTGFAYDDDNTSGDWKSYFEVNTTANNYKSYRMNTLEDDFGLNIKRLYLLALDLSEVVEIVDRNGNVGVVEDGDVIGLMGWKVEHHTTPYKFVHLSLSITYPYRLKELKNQSQKPSLEKLSNIPIETINLKTSTKSLP
jgi:prepilin-type N-terminal cleavage/methylation domain-containing protein